MKFKKIISGIFFRRSADKARKDIANAENVMRDMFRRQTDEIHFSFGNESGLNASDLNKGHESFGDSQEAKADNGKAKLSLVPMEIMYAVARVREYGVKKYGSKENWKAVNPDRYKDALLRHISAYIENPEGKDAESDLPHIWHVACNVAFLIAMKYRKEDI